MGELRPIPRTGDVFADVRGEDRTMRVSWHADRGIVVVSLWAGRVCRGSFRLARTELPRLRDLLAEIDRCAEPATTGPATTGPATTGPVTDGQPEHTGAVTLPPAGDAAAPAGPSDEVRQEAC